jgi:uncharacterized membrane protein YdjX (TVP38/TMEM64 family)
MLVAGVLATLLVVFFVVEWVDVPLLVDPQPALDTISVAAAMIGVGLLVVDAIVPVPSSVVMVALGATFGFIGGLVLSVGGSVGGFAVGYLIGRRSRESLGSVLDGGDGVRAAALVRRWGVLAVVVSRPLPLVAETVAFSIGAFGMRPLVAFMGAVVGAIGPAAAFSYAGWRGASTTDGAVVFVLVAVAASLCWAAGHHAQNRSPGTDHCCGGDHRAQPRQDPEQPEIAVQEPEVRLGSDVHDLVPRVDDRVA